tara:strand:+ start:1757 stop:2209 length:453 start_codon:yes stop_codon:yes gene_type:complete
MKKIKILLAFILIFYGCTYEPILATKKFDFIFEVINHDGEEIVNKIIKNKLEQRKVGSKNYSINIKSLKNKKIISTDSKGDPTVFEINIKLNYDLIENNEVIFRDSIQKQITYNNINDKFELSKYEESILKNLSNNIGNEILISISSLNK